MTTPCNWTPVLRGDTYCSPACGMGCKKSAYDEAHRKAYALAERMTGNAWSIRVWENLGWHYEIIRENRATGFRCSIMERLNPDGTGHYVVYFNSRPQIITKGNDPNAALAEAVQEARRMANTLTANADLFPEYFP